MRADEELGSQVQSAWADLVDAVHRERYAVDFPLPGKFLDRQIKGQRYWYWQTSAGGQGQRQIYVGKDSPEIQARIEHHEAERKGWQIRRQLVQQLSALRLPSVNSIQGDIIAALADAGVFRLRGVLVGTTAFQLYPFVVGRRPPSALGRTVDLDVAQFREVSVQLGETIEAGSMLEVLQRVRKTFRAAPTLRGRAAAYRYEEPASQSLVEFLAPLVGKDEEIVSLPALKTDAAPLRFMDLLLRDPIAAAVLHADGVAISIPAPARYALHKLIVADRRIERDKRPKDLAQAGFLIRALAVTDPFALRAVWHELKGKGAGWREPAYRSLSSMPFNDVVESLAAAAADDELPVEIERVRTGAQSGTEQIPTDDGPAS